jgi:hypothetical protein
MYIPDGLPNKDGKEIRKLRFTTMNPSYCMKWDDARDNFSDVDRSMTHLLRSFRKIGMRST